MALCQAGRAVRAGEGGGGSEGYGTIFIRCYRQQEDVGGAVDGFQGEKDKE